MENYREIRQKYYSLRNIKCPENIKGEEKKRFVLNVFNKSLDLLVNFFTENYFIYTTKNDIKTEIWIYKDGIYVPNGRSEIKEILRKILLENYSLQIAQKILDKIEVDTYIEIKDFFKFDNKHEIAVNNGILNIFTLELMPFNPKKIFFNKFPVKYNLNAKCEKIEAFLKEVLSNPDDINVFYEICGYGLLKEYKFEKAFMFIGFGRNGKGKSIELIKRMVGVENCVSLPLSTLIPESFSISELFGKVYNLAGDIGHKDLKDTSMFKSLTGRDLINGKRKFMTDLPFQNYAKFVFACNELPSVYDTSKGFWDRWILLEFPYTFVTEYEYNNSDDKSKLKIRDESIIDKITSEEELSGLLNESLIALHRLMKNKNFSSTKGSDEIKTLWIRNSNSFMAFCLDNIKSKYDGKILKKDLRINYTKYCQLHKLKVKSDIVIKNVLNEEYGVSEFRDYEQNTYWEGVEWKKNIKPFDEN